MKYRVVYFLAFLVMITFSNLGFTDDSASVRSYPIPSHGKLELRFPDKWKSGFGEVPGGLPPTITIGPANKDIYIKVTVFWNLNNEPDFNDHEKLKASAYRIGNDQLSGSVESKIKLIEIIGSKNRGYYYTITDKNPKPGEWKYMSQGFVAVKDLQLVFTILSHKKSSGDIDDAILMFKEAINK